MNRPIIAAIAFVLSAFVTACTADLRGPSLTDAPISADAEARGRQLLKRAADAHGVAAYAGHSTVEYVYRDDWESTLAAVMGLEPWDAEDLIRMRVVRGTFDGRIDFVGGPRTGESWGTRAGEYWAREEGEVKRMPDEGEGFMLRALTYFFEIPFRIGDATVVVYAGEAEFEGRRYDQVMATWDTLEPNDHDQYVLWIDRETGRIGLVDFTVREQGAFFESRNIYADYREVDGVVLPFRMTITDLGAGSSDSFVHELVAESVSFDAFPASAIDPDEPVATR